jgi:hypothetical protein
VAVIDRFPAGNELVVNVAVEPLNGDVPRRAHPFLKVTLPTGTGSPRVVLIAVTVAVKVTESPIKEGFSDEDATVEVGTLVTVWLRTAEVLVRSLLSPK